MREGFVFQNADALMAFWRAVKMFKIDEPATRTALLRKFTNRQMKRQKAQYVRDGEAFLKQHRVAKATDLIKGDK